MDWKLIAEIVSIMITVVGAVWSAYHKLKDQIAELKTESAVTKAILTHVQETQKELAKDIHNIAVILKLPRALAEEEAKVNEEKSECHSG